MRMPFTLLVAFLAVAGSPRPMAALPSPTDRAAATANPLWEPPGPRDRDLFNGPWGAEAAPDPAAVYTFIRHKEGGVNPGVIVRDPHGRVWHVKQAPRSDQGNEGPVEVALSRVLSAIGYHQPPVYYLSSFMLKDGQGVHAEPGGRFRLTEPSLHSRGNWSWKDPSVRGTRPYNALLAILLVFTSWDLKDSNNEIYDVVRDGHVSRWYVVRDLGGALGASGRYFVKRNNVEAFEREPYIDGWRDGFVHFDYGGKRPDLVRHLVTLDDLRWATALLESLSDQQWHDAFRAGAYGANTSDRFIHKIKSNIRQAQQLTGAVASVATRKR